MTRVLHDINMNYKIEEKRNDQTKCLKLMSIIVSALKVIFGVWSKFFVEGIKNDGHKFIISEIVEPEDKRKKFNFPIFGEKKEKTHIQEKGLELK